MLNENGKIENLQKKRAGFTPKPMQGTNGHMRILKGNPMHRLNLSKLGAMGGHSLAELNATIKSMQISANAKGKDKKEKSQTNLGKRPMHEMGLI